jgi:hypothetical protein
MKTEKITREEVDRAKELRDRLIAFLADDGQSLLITALALDEVACRIIEGMFGDAEGQRRAVALEAAFHDAICTGCDVV